MGRIALLFLILSFSFVSFSQAEFKTFEVVPNQSKVTFELSEFVIRTVEGHFGKFSGQIIADPEKKTLRSVKGTVYPATIETGVDNRNKRIQEHDFFHTEKFPQSVFTSKRITGSGKEITVVGDLTIGKQTREVTLKGGFVEPKKGNDPKDWVAFEASGIVSPRGFKMVFYRFKMGRMVLGDDAKVTLKIQAKDVAAKAKPQKKKLIQTSRKPKKQVSSKKS